MTLGDGLAAGVHPGHVDGLDEALDVAQVFGLVRSLFSTSPEDTVLKLVVLFQLGQADGRFPRERVRQLVRAVDAARLEGIVDSLYRGGWLELRAADNTYRVNPLGLFLLAVLRAANFGSQTPANALARAAETLQFGDRVDEDGATTRRLLGMLLAELENQAAHARDVLRRGRPRELIRFSRSDVRRQVDHVVQVLSTLEARLPEASEQFGRLVRLHEAMQAVLRAHEGLARRLTEWNLQRLETTDAGYSLSALCEAVVGASDEELEGAFTERALTPPGPAVGLSTDALLDRHRTDRATRRRARAPFVYASPPEPEVERLQPEDVDPVARLRAVLSEWAAGATPGDELPLADVLAEHARDFADAVLQLGLLARLEGTEPRGIDVGTDRRVLPLSPSLDGEALAADVSVEALVEVGILARVPERGLHTAVSLRLLSEVP